MSNLVLTRYPNEDSNTIIIDHRIKVVVVSVKGKQVRLAFEQINDLEPQINVCREEVYVGPTNVARRSKAVNPR